MRNEKISQDFEEKIKKLDAITQDLSHFDMPLLQMMNLFEEGMKLSKECLQIIENAKKRINFLVQEVDLISSENKNETPYD